MTVPEATPASILHLFPHIKDDPATLPHSIDPFTITTSTGFLPYQLPPTTLPDSFKPLNDILDRLPVKRLDGTPGLLDSYELGAAVKTDLPDLTAEVDKLLTKYGKPDVFTITAVFRDYAFLASAYLLEPCWENWRKNPTGGYGLGREFLPRAIAGPMVRCAEMYVAYEICRCHLALTVR